MKPGVWGGLGVCGEPLCCTAFIQEFEPISTQYAKDQHLPLNPCKLTGVCGRLKCCLLYEKSFYSATLKKFPALETEINTDRGKAVIDKVDIFREMVYLKYLDDEAVECHSLREVEKILKKQNVNA
jgi:cell fate regulator YaaT (PSP1 superfamily)